MIKLVFSRDDSGREIEKLLDGIEITGAAAAIYRQAVADVRDDQGGDYLGESVRGKEVTEMGWSGEDAAALTRDSPHVRVPRQVLVEDDAEIFDFSAWCQTRVLVHDFDRGEAAQILSGPESDELEFTYVNL